MADKTESVADLQKHIEDLSCAIELQKQVLRDLEKHKSKVQGRLNAILDPVARLPLELSSDIFLRCVSGDAAPDKYSAPMIFLGVCRSWSDIALSTVLLWAAICVPRGRHEDFPKLMERWILRAGSRLLRLSLDEDPSPVIHDLVHNNAHRVENLGLNLSSGAELLRITIPFPSLTTLTIGQGPRDDDEEDSDDEENGFSEDPSVCVQILIAPNLVECTFDSISYHHRNRKPTPTTHSSLKHLRFESYDTNDLAILWYLTLPALESLWLPCFGTIAKEYPLLLKFLTRSPSPLHSLRLRMPYEWCIEGGGIAIEEFCALVPNLAELELYISHPKLYTFFEVVSDREFSMLRTLTIRGYRPPRPVYETLLNFLTTRRSQIKSFRVIASSLPAPTEPEPDLLVRLRQLVADGMKIHIGTETENYI